MTTLDYLMDVVAGLRARLDLAPAFRWAVVVGIDPLRVQLDGDTGPLSADPINLAGALTAGQRVYTMSVNRRLHILGLVSKAQTPPASPRGGPKPLVHEDQMPPAGSSVPAGTIVAYAGVSLPPGWLLCDGASYRRAHYPALAAALGATGAGAEFMVPDLRDRFLMGASAARPTAQMGGEETHALTVEEMPPHAHRAVGSGAWQGGAGIGPSNAGSGSGWTTVSAPGAGQLGYLEAAATGGGQPHNNLPPYYAVDYIIKA